MDPALEGIQNCKGCWIKTPVTMLRSISCFSIPLSLLATFSYCPELLSPKVLVSFPEMNVLKACADTDVITIAYITESEKLLPETLQADICQEGRFRLEREQNLINPVGR